MDELVHDVTISLGTGLPCDPEKFGVAGPDRPLKGECPLRAASNAREANSEELDMRPLAKLFSGFLWIIWITWIDKEWCDKESADK